MYDKKKQLGMVPKVADSEEDAEKIPAFYAFQRKHPAYNMESLKAWEQEREKHMWEEPELEVEEKKTLAE